MYAQAKRQRGFTIVELLVALAVAAVLIGVALPAFNGLMAQRRLTSQVNDFMVALQYARSEAAKRGTMVTVQSLDAADDANEWGAGYCVVVGDPGDCTDALRTFDPIGDNTLDASGALDARDSISFSARGLMVGGGAGTADLCDPVQERGRRVAITLTGRVSSQELDCVP
jgi:prepilin-type N-terminal cleavage/methylation domain-containing protein